MYESRSASTRYRCGYAARHSGQLPDYALTGRGLARFVVAALWLLVNGTAFGQTQTVDVAAKSYSFAFGRATLSNGDGILLTTYDGSSEVPLGCSEVRCVANAELSPAQVGGGSYRADYLAVNFLGVYEYGTLSVSIPATDNDNNGMPDVLEPEQSGAFTYSGSGQCHFNSSSACETFSISATVSRAVTSVRGTYSGFYEIPTSGISLSFSGAMELVGAFGSGEYQFGEDTLDLSVTTVQEGYNYQGSVVFSRVGVSQILLPSMTLTDPGNGKSITSEPVTLNRTGNVYRGHLVLQDGDPDTTWVDYTDLLLEITDNNDSNGDGIPDLSNFDPCADLGGDTDGDEVCDNDDNCPLTVNPEQENLDGDGLGDVCDPCPLDVTNADLDGDGACAELDNCPYTQNPEQSDSGGFDTANPNATGDSCECGDISGDGIVDLLDIVILWRDLFDLLPGLVAPEKCRVAALGNCDGPDLAALRDALAGLTLGVESLCLAAAPRVSVDLDGESEYLANETENSVGIGNVWTFSMWIRDREFATATADYLQLFRADLNSYVYIHQTGNGSSNPLSVLLYNTAGQLFKQFLWDNVMSPADVFHHLVVIWDGTGLSFYVDGEIRAVSTVAVNGAGAMEDSERQVYLGGTAYLDGLVGHSALWDTALGADEVAQIFWLGHSIDLRTDIGGYQSSNHLKHYWRLGEDPTGIARDFAIGAGIDIGVDAVGLTFDDDAVFDGP